MKLVYNNAQVNRTQALWQYVTGQNIPAWNSATAYLPGDTVTYGGFGWYCTQANTNETPALGSTYWQIYDAVGTGVRNMILKDFYFIGPPVYYSSLGDGSVEQANYGAFPLVDGDYPLSYKVYPDLPQGVGINNAPANVIKFQPFAIEKDKLTYKTGFEASNLTLTLRPRDPNAITTYTGGSMSPYGGRGVSASTFTTKQSFSESLQVFPPYSDLYALGSQLYQTMRQSFAQGGDWFLAPVTMWRAFMPTPGDLDTFGAAVMFRGRVSSFSVDKEDVKITVASLMEVFQQKVPTQTVQPGNRWAPFNFQVTEDYVGSGSGVSGGYNWITCSFTPQGSAPAVADGVFAEGFALIYNSNGQWWRKVYTNAGTSGSTTTVTWLEPLPLSTNGGNWTVKLWLSGTTENVSGQPGQGFPYVPQPLTQIT